ncbi:MAG: T9SS type A sorting domain-containing protein, partial [Bacteroidota bacterium]
MKTRKLQFSGLVKSAMAGILIFGGICAYAQPQNKAAIFSPKYVKFGVNGTSTVLNLPTGMDYDGTPARRAQNIQLTASGQINFFIIDSYVYNGSGAQIADLMSNTGETAVGISEIVVAPLYGNTFIVVTNYLNGNGSVIHPKAFRLDMDVPGSYGLPGAVEQIYDFPEVTSVQQGQDFGLAMVQTKNLSITHNYYALFVNDSHYTHAYRITDFKNTVIYTGRSENVPGLMNAGNDRRRSELEAVVSGRDILVAGNTDYTVEGTDMFVARFRNNTDLGFVSTTPVTIPPSPAQPGNSGVITGLEFSRNKQVIHFVTDLAPYVGYYNIATNTATYYSQSTALPTGIDYSAYKYSGMETMADGHVYVCSANGLSRLIDSDMNTITNRFQVNAISLPIPFTNDRLNSLPERRRMINDQVDFMCYPETHVLDGTINVNTTLTGLTTATPKDDNFYLNHRWKVTQYNAIRIQPLNITFVVAGPVSHNNTITRGDQSITFPTVSLTGTVYSYFLIEHTPLDSNGCSSGSTVMTRYDIPVLLSPFPEGGLLKQGTTTELTEAEVAEIVAAAEEGKAAAAGIHGIAGYSNTKVYPNPISDVLKIESDQPVSTVRVINAVGQVMLTANQPGTALNTSALPTGTYIVELEFADGSKTQK